MFADRFMVKNPATVGPGARVNDAIDIMHKANTNMLPVIDADGKVCGELTTYDLLKRVAPEYIASGDLKDASFAPDIGVLARHCREVLQMRVEEVMSDAPLLVKENESLLAVTADLIGARGRHDYALVVDDERHLLGVISPRDILDRLRRLKFDEAHEHG